MSRVKLLMTAAAIVAATAMAAPANAQRVVVFGDSLSDSGNVSAITGGFVPGSPLGRWSTGYNWVDLLYGPSWGLAFKLGGAPTGNISGNVNYAVGGAYAGTNNLGSSVAPGTPLAPGQLPGTDQEIALFGFLNGFSHTTFAPTDTATIWSGANNAFYSLGFVKAAMLTPAAAAAYLSGAATTAATNEINNITGNTQPTGLIPLGAKKIVVLNLPDLGTLPGIANQGTSASQGGTLFTGVFNGTLSAGLSGVAAANPTVNIIQADIFSAFKVIAANPAAFGFTNLTTGCLFTGGAACNGLAFADSTNALGAVHPTQAAYALIARYVGLLSDATPALLQTARLGESGLYSNELLTNAVFDRLSAFISGTYSGKNGPFAEVLGSYSTAGNSGGTPGISMSIGGVRAGIDKKNGATLSGASVAYVDGSQSSGATKNDIQSVRADIYGTALFGNAYISGDAGISSLTLSNIQRDTGFPTVIASGHTGGFVASAAAEAGVAVPMGGWTLIPSARATYFHSEVNGYDETAPILAMSYADRTIDAVLLGGKVRAVTNVPGIGLAAVGYGEVGYEGYVSSSSSNLKSTFINNTAFPTIVNPGDPISPGILGKVGLSTQVSAGMYLDFQYGIAVHDDGGQTHSGDLRLKASY